jgi:RHS repeat-associated protein
MTHSVAYATDVRSSWSRCTGKERDTESGNDYSVSRYYASRMGRFVSVDPFLIRSLIVSCPLCERAVSQDALANPLHSSEFFSGVLILRDVIQSLLFLFPSVFRLSNIGLVEFRLRIPAQVLQRKHHAEQA